MEYRIIYGDGECSEGFKEKDLEELLEDIKISAENAKENNQIVFVVTINSY